MRRTKAIRDNDRKRLKEAIKNKKYKDYNWNDLGKSEEVLGKLGVFELYKYLAFHGLSKNGNKGDKVSRIMTHWILTKDQFAQKQELLQTVRPSLKQNTMIRRMKRKTISDDDDSCDESNADDEVIAVMSGDDSETINAVEDEGQNTDDLSNEENNIVGEQACNLIENRTRSRRIVILRRYNDIWTYL